MGLKGERNLSSPSNHSKDAMFSNEDVKPSMSDLGGSIQGRESADGHGSFASTSDPSDSNMIVTLCYFCLSETIFQEALDAYIFSFQISSIYP